VTSVTETHDDQWTNTSPVEGVGPVPDGGPASHAQPQTIADADAPPPAVPVEQTGDGPGTGVGTYSFDPSVHDAAYQSAGGPEETYHARIVSTEEAARLGEQAIAELADRIGKEAEAPSVDDTEAAREADARIADLADRVGREADTSAPSAHAEQVAKDADAGIADVAERVGREADAPRVD